VLVNGPTNNGNGALDYDGKFEISSGTLIAAGSVGMAMATSDSSSQPTVSMILPQIQQAGTIVRLEDGEGNEIATFAPSKSYQSVVVSSPELQQGKTYTFFSGGASTGSVVDGLYAGGDYTGGTEVVSFETASIVTWVNESGVTTGNTGGFGGGMGGGPGRGRGNGGGMGGGPGGGRGDGGGMEAKPGQGGTEGMGAMP